MRLESVGLSIILCSVYVIILVLHRRETRRHPHSGVRSSAISRPRRNELAILGSSEPVARHPPQGLSALARVEQRLAPADVP